MTQTNPLHDILPSKPLARIIVAAGGIDRDDVPVCADLAGVVLPNRPLALRDAEDGERPAIPAQVEEGTAARLHWIMPGRTAAGAVRTFHLVAEEARAGHGIAAIADDRVLDIIRGGALLLRYNHAPVPPPEGFSQDYTRSGFIHPLCSPAGQVLTGIHPPDHIHHMGLWNPWTHCRFEGREVDFWNLAKGEGTVRFGRFLSSCSGPVFGGFTALQEHVALKMGEGEKVALREELQVRAWNAPARGCLIDYTTCQRCASASPLVLLQYRYGGFGFRATAQWRMGNSDFLTSEGRTRKDGHATRSRWCIASGTSDRGPAGVLFMSHPGNHGHPEPMRLWAEGPIFFNYCPVQEGDWMLEPGQAYVLRYRLFVFDGALSPADAERLWGDFAAPCRASVEAPCGPSGCSG